MTVDQRGSQTRPDAVPSLDALVAPGSMLRPFERTAGDEAQCLLDEPEVVVDLVVALLRAGAWSVGVGIGDVDEPLAASVRANRGPAFVAARRAVERARRSAAHVAVEGAGAEHVETAMILLASVLDRRTDAGWEAVDAMATAATQTEAATVLGISPQAMNRRLHVAGYVEERRGRALVAHLLAEAR